MTRLVALLFAVLPRVALAATLDVPSHGDRLSGIGVIHGWKCDPQNITVSVAGSAPIPALSPYPRADTGGVCGNAGWNGFFTFVNWAIFGDGPHTIIAFDNDIPFASRTFTVTTLGEEFVTGVAKRATIADFPAPGESVELEWNQSTQHFEIVGNTATPPGEDEEPDPTSPTASVYGSCYADFECPEGSENPNLMSQVWCSREETCVESVVQAWCGLGTRNGLRPKQRTRRPAERCVRTRDPARARHIAILTLRPTRACRPGVPLSEPPYPPDGRFLTQGRDRPARGYSRATATLCGPAWLRPSLRLWGRIAVLGALLGHLGASVAAALPPVGGVSANGRFFGQRSAWAVPSDNAHCVNLRGKGGAAVLLAWTPLPHP